ncbi:hypothetical protein [Kitasatospora purpeofusca]|uniref:hypothetical protein n=1 Tax=Kitasatospora purpeofusca TaxID=67352 RepID=UPI003870675D|nr:hypothetical protein OIP63_16150 [Kitasatospora purpeofusca]
MFGRDPKPPESGQQRRAKAVREADRAGQRQIDSHRSSRSTTAWHRAESPRAWWRSS